MDNQYQSPTNKECDKSLERRNRFFRLHRWLQEVGSDIQSTTRLLGDITVIVADFLVSLEYVWMPLPNRLRNKSCECTASPSNTFKSCQCCTWPAQHVCTTKKIGESQASEFTITVGFEGGRQNWWLGILSSPTVDGLQTVTRPSEYYGGVFEFDSMKEIPNLSATLCSHQGLVHRFNQGGFAGPSYPLFEPGQTSGPISITIQVGNDINGFGNEQGNFANDNTLARVSANHEATWIQFFCDGRQSPRLRCDKIQISDSRLFVQFGRAGAGFSTATIHTPPSTFP
jgi:hypothetical protein